MVKEITDQIKETKLKDIKNVGELIGLLKRHKQEENDRAKECFP